ncbi:MAG: hypothetical protein ACMG6H_16350, partial [Acidobacteriota bacterium]
KDANGRAQDCAALVGDDGTIGIKRTCAFHFSGSYLFDLMWRVQVREAILLAPSPHRVEIFFAGRFALERGEMFFAGRFAPPERKPRRLKLCF